MALLAAAGFPRESPLKSRKGALLIGKTGFHFCLERTRFRA